MHICDAWRDLASQIRTLTDRIQQLERQAGAKISDAQRGVIYQMVPEPGAPRLQRPEPRSSTRGRLPNLCAKFSVKARFKLSRYEDLPASK